MKVVVIVDFPHIDNPDSEEAGIAIDELSDDLEASLTGNYNWYVDDALGETKDE